MRFQSRALKKQRLPLVGVLRAALISWLPFRILKKMFAQAIESGQAARSTATMVYSNIGMMFVDKKGEPFFIILGKDGVVDRLRFSNPIAYPVAASLATITIGGHILISLSYLDPVLDREAMIGMLKRFQSELYAVMDEEVLMTEPLPPFSETLERIEGAEGEIYTHETFE